MKLRNKKTGEIGNLITICAATRVFTDGESDKVYESLAELNEEWEDYEDPKSGIENIRLNDMISGRYIVEIDFTKVEEAEKAVEKLKAWKRLKDKGFKFGGWKRDERHYGDYTIEAQDYTTCDDKDLDLLFGGEE